MSPLEFVYARGLWQSQLETGTPKPLKSDSPRGRGSSSNTTSAPGRKLEIPLPPPPRGALLVLSEFATASQVLSACLSTNPWNIPEVRAPLPSCHLLAFVSVYRARCR